jgi:hypothetical protein
MNVEIGTVGGKCGVRDRRRDARGRHWTTDGNWGTCRDAFVWDRA